MQAEDWLARRAALSPDRLALVDTSRGDREINYGEWNASANRTARFLRDRLDVRKGDRVAVLARNSVAYLDIWFALNKLGAVLQNLNWRLTAAELTGLVADAGPVCLFYGPDFAETAGSVAAALGDAAPRLACLCESCEHPDALLQERVHHDAADLPDPGLSLDDPWVICYTGGTTGLPKGAVLTYRSITANAVNTIVSWGLSPEDTTILNSPLFHTGGLNVFTAPLVYLGGASYVCSEFNLDQTFDLLGSGRITVWFGVPTMFVMMQNHPRWESADLSACRFLISGGAPCPQPVFDRFWARGVDFKTGYGLTEAGPNTFWLPPGEVQSKPGAVGYPLFHVDVQIVGPDGALLAPGEVGELRIRGPHLFAGYWQQPEETAGVLVDGWLRTGDLACCDADGCYRIMGRIKDLIISGGENIYPAEIESILHNHPAVVEAAVIPVPDEKWGEVGWAVVVLRRPEGEAGLADFCAVRLARYKVPRRFLIVDELPKTGANKVDKQALVRMFVPRPAGL